LLLTQCLQSFGMALVNYRYCLHLNC
jgi:hypothetical protein